MTTEIKLEQPANEKSSMLVVSDGITAPTKLSLHPAVTSYKPGVESVVIFNGLNGVLVNAVDPMLVTPTALST